MIGVSAGCGSCTGDGVGLGEGLGDGLDDGDGVGVGEIAAVGDVDSGEPTDPTGDDGDSLTATVGAALDLGVAGGVANAAANNMARPIDNQPTTATSLLGERNTGSRVLIPRTLNASKTTHMDRMPKIPSAGLVGNCTSQAAMTKYANRATSALGHFPVRNPGTWRYEAPVWTAAPGWAAGDSERLETW